MVGQVIFVLLFRFFNMKFMKTPHFILLAVFGLIMASCRLTGDAESTPEIYLKAMRIAGKDTTYLHFMGNVLDTIRVGDTITFRTDVYSQYNNLLQYKITSSREKSVEFIWSDIDESLGTLFTSETDYDKGLFVMPGTFSHLYFPFKYIAKEDEKNLTITFSILNDASRNYNSISTTIVTPIKAAKKE